MVAAVLMTEQSSYTRVYMLMMCKVVWYHILSLTLFWQK